MDAEVQQRPPGSQFSGTETASAMLPPRGGRESRKRLCVDWSRLDFAGSEQDQHGRLPMAGYSRGSETMSNNLKISLIGAGLALAVPLAAQAAHPPGEWWHHHPHYV